VRSPDSPWALASDRSVLRQLYWILACGGLFAVVYFARSFFQKSSPILPEIMNLFLGAAGVVSGVKCCYLTIDEKLPLNGEDRLFFFLGGLLPSAFVLKIEASREH